MVLQGKGPWTKTKSEAGQTKKDKPMEPSVPVPVPGEAANGKPKNSTDEKTDQKTPAGVSDCKIKISDGKFHGIGHGCIFGGDLRAAPPGLAKNDANATALAGKAADGKAKKGADATGVAVKAADGKAKKGADEKTVRKTPARVSGCEIKIDNGNFQGIGHGCIFGGDLDAARCT